MSEVQEERSLELRRAREAERLKRIKDPAMRMAVDTAALAAQVAEKAAAKAEDEERSKAYGASLMYMDGQLCYLEAERRKAERAQLAELDQFRAATQQKWQARDFDLSDPNALKAGLPARLGDDDPRLSVSGMQKFHGEDLGHAYKIQAQRAELTATNSALSASKAAAAASLQAEDDAFAASMLQIDGMKVSLEAAAQEARGATLRAVSDYNQAQAAAKRERERALQSIELQQNVEEIQTQLSGAVLTEDPLIGRSCIAPNRLRPDHYKGMAPEEQALIVAEQAAQRVANEAKAAADKAAKAAADAAQEHIRLQRCAGEARVAGMRAEMRKSVMMENQALAQEHSASKSFLETKVYPNEVTEDFFSQFNTTSR